MITKESILKTLNSINISNWIKKVFIDIVNMFDNKADLIGGKIPQEQLPSYVDDVINYYSILSYQTLINNLGNDSYSNLFIYVSDKEKFYNTSINKKESDFVISDPELGKIYINTANNHSYRWTGSLLLDLDKDITDAVNNVYLKTAVFHIGRIYDINDILKNYNNLKDLYNNISFYSAIRSNVVFDFHIVNENNTFIYTIHTLLVDETNHEFVIMLPNNNIVKYKLNVVNNIYSYTMTPLYTFTN